MIYRSTSQKQRELKHCLRFLRLTKIGKLTELILQVCSEPAKLQGHPTEYFGKISVRMEGRLRISKFFPSDALDFSNFFGKP